MPAPSKYKEGKGCHHCGGSGLRGRVGVYELLELSDELGSAMLENQLDTFEKQQLQKNSLWVSAFEKADQGQTTFAEIRRVLGNAEGLTK
jgi:MSHA biogenesis protein MshE